MARILVTQGDYKGQEIELLGKEIIIGREDDCDLSLNDTEVSRHHAKIYCENGVWHVADLDSANGSILNNKPVKISVLSENDVVSIGGTTFIFKNGSAPVAAAGAPAAPSAVRPCPAAASAAWFLFQSPALNPGPA